MGRKLDFVAHKIYGNFTQPKLKAFSANATSLTLHKIGGKRNQNRNKNAIQLYMTL